MNRRAFLRDLALASAAAAISARAADPVAPGGFTHRALNGWITDLATEPDPHAAWPSMRLDERLLQDYRETFALMERIGFNEIVIWGLYTANNWPVDLAGAVTPERGRLVERLIADAHARGIKVISGLGTYNWGFAEIIKANPKLNGGNANAMCASEPESHAWMERVLEFVFTRFAIDGVSMQSADQGRCKCERCAKTDDAGYHATLLARTADTIRARWPGKITGMSNWGVSFGHANDREVFAKMSRSLDYMIDYNDSARNGGAENRRKLIAALGCAFGTTGGLVVEPPQHWARDRWFLPTCRGVHRHLQKLHADGGRACEFFFHIAANPASELTLHIAGRTLAAPAEPLEKHLHSALDELYQPRDADARTALAGFFLDAEQAYFRHLPADECGTLSLEPLISNESGPAVYLRDRLLPAQREMYAREIGRLTGVFEKLRVDLPTAPRVGRITACLSAVPKDLAHEPSPIFPPRRRDAWRLKKSKPQIS